MFTEVSKPLETVNEQEEHTRTLIMHRAQGYTEQYT